MQNTEYNLTIFINVLREKGEVIAFMEQMKAIKRNIRQNISITKTRRAEIKMLVNWLEEKLEI